MGVAQSKKRRKDRKRRWRWRQQGEGPLSGHFDIPRSVSLDTLRIHGVTSPSSAAACCPHCGGWSWAWGHAGGGGLRGHDRRTLSGLLESSGACHGFHRCLRGQYDDMHGSGSHARGGYDSEDDDRLSYHPPCPACSMSKDDVLSLSSMHAQTMACPGPEHSTMSLNRVTGRKVHSKIFHSAEFPELLGILKHQQENQSHQQREVAETAVPGGNISSHATAPSPTQPASSPPVRSSSFKSTLPDQSNRVVMSRAAPSSVEATILAHADSEYLSLPGRLATKPPHVTSSSSGVTPPVSSDSNPPVTQHAPFSEAIFTAGLKKPVTVLEDEETRLARWEKQKLMSEQLRLLRKHLLAREKSLKANNEATHDSDPVPLYLKGPLDAVESYITSHSSSNCSEDASDNSQPSSRLFAESGSRGCDHVTQSQSCPPHSMKDFSKPDSEPTETVETVMREERTNLSATSPCTFSPLLRSQNPEPPEPHTASDKDNVRSSQQSGGTPSCAAAAQFQASSHLRSKFARSGQNYRYLDNHPVLSRLQNEQNLRLERMERKMRCIRASAEQAAERKKFEQIFPARQDVLAEDEKRRMKEAEETLTKLKEENKKFKQLKKTPAEATVVQTAPSCAKDSRNADDSGEVIPVHVVPSGTIQLIPNTEEATSAAAERRVSEEVKTRSSTSREQEKKLQEMGKNSNWVKSTFSNIDLGNPLAWLALPFLLFPLLLRLLLSVALSSKPSPTEPPARASHSQDNSDAQG